MRIAQGATSGALNSDIAVFTNNSLDVKRDINTTGNIYLNSSNPDSPQVVWQSQGYGDQYIDNYQGRLRVVNSGAEQLVIEQGGNTTLNGNLDVTGKITVASTDPEIFLTDTSTSVTHSIDGNSGVGNLFMHVDKDETGSDPKFVVNVGSQDNVLVVKSTGVDVTGTVEADFMKISTPDAGGSPATTAILDIYGYEGRGAGIKIRDSANSASGASNREWFVGSGYNQTGFNIGYAPLGNNSSYVNQSKLTIDTSGNVGVGLSVPTAKMHIKDVTNTSGSTTGSTLLRLDNDVNGDLSQQKTFIDFALFDSNANEVPQVRIGAEVGPNSDANSTEKEGEGAFVIYTNNATTGGTTPTGLNERMRVDYLGNVGINTATPAAKLDVRGDVRIEADTGFAFMEMGGPSGAFIDLKSPFSDDYDLRVQQDGGQSKIRTTGSSIQVDTNSGYLLLGPQNASYSHFSTDRPKFYFNKQIDVASGIISSYGADLSLRRGTSTTNALTIASGSATFGVQLNVPTLNVGSASAAGSGFIVSPVTGPSRALQTVGSVNTTQTHIGFENLYGEIGRIDVSAFSVSYVTSSDYRLKTDIQPMQGSIDRVKALKPVNFEWKEDGTRVDGFLAHEAQEVVPEAVSGEKDATKTNKDGVEVPDYQGIDQSKLVPLLTSALQEALAKIDDLELRMANLEN
jgi:hypothetical protein